MAYNRQCQYELKGREHQKKIQLENEHYKNYRVYSISNLFLSPSGNRFQNKKARRNNQKSLDHYKYFKQNKMQEYQHV